VAAKSIPPLNGSDASKFAASLRRDQETGCLLWIGYKYRNGYGRFRVGGRSVYAHRLAFALAGGETSDDRRLILHSCDNRACCEPSHLRAGSQGDNLKDMASRKRGVTSRRGLPFGVQPHGSGFQAQLKDCGINHYLGTYSTVAAAAAVAAEAKAVAIRSWRRRHEG
jgi:hypothetical protein